MGAGTHDESYIDSTKDVAAFTPLAARPMLDVATLAPLAAIVETASATESDASPKALMARTGWPLWMGEVRHERISKRYQRIRNELEVHNKV